MIRGLGLVIEPSEFVDTIEGDTEPADEWQDWHIEDLERLLQDKLVKRTYLIIFGREFETSKKHINTKFFAKHGWKVIMGLGKDESYCKLEDKGRKRATVTEHASWKL